MGGGSKRISPLLSMLLRTLTGTTTASYEPIAPSLWATQGDLRPRLRRATKWHACSLLCMQSRVSSSFVDGCRCCRGPYRGKTIWKNMVN